MADTNKTPAAEILTDDMIIALRREASEAGDPDMCQLCNSALNGNANHRAHVAHVITEARAQDDSQPFVRVVP